jgi:hypothetical protein
MPFHTMKQLQLQPLSSSSLSLTRLLNSSFYSAHEMQQLFAREIISNGVDGVPFPMNILNMCSLSLSVHSL